MSQFSEEPLYLSADDGFGYFPTYPGASLKENRYKVIRKLGFGLRSSVWLVKDSKDEDKYHAIKILTVHATLQETHELRTLQLICQERLYFDGLPNLYDTFVEKSHHGDHQCLALVVMGLDLDSLRLTSPTKALPVHTIQKTVASVLDALTSLHARRIIHGAVIPQNFTFVVAHDIESINEDLKSLPSSVIEEKVAVADVEYPIVLSEPIPHGYEYNDPCNVIADYSIYLSNVGHSQPMTRRGNPSWEKAHIADASLRPPEVILEMSYDNQVDIWMLGCATYRLLTGEALFSSDTVEDDANHLAQMMALTGNRIKKSVALKSKRREEFFTDMGEYSRVLYQILASMQGSLPLDKLPGADIAAAATFLKACLALDPEVRRTAGALKKHEWVKPGYACSCGYC